MDTAKMLKARMTTMMIVIQAAGVISSFQKEMTTEAALICGRN